MILKIMINDGWNKKPEGWEEVNIYDHNNITDKLDIAFNYDSIFVLAGGINQNGECHEWVKRRLDLAVKLYNFSNENIYCLGGGSYHVPPILNKKKFTIHESTACAEYLIGKGVKSKKIFKEWSSFDTIANGVFGFNNFIVPLKLKKIVVITSNFHMNRSKAIFNWINSLYNNIIEIKFLSVSDKNIDDELISIRTTKENKSLENLKKNVILKYSSLQEMLNWFYTEHKAYCSTSEMDRSVLIDEDTKKTY